MIISLRVADGCSPEAVKSAERMILHKFFSAFKGSGGYKRCVILAKKYYGVISL